MTTSSSAGGRGRGGCGDSASTTGADPIVAGVDRARRRALAYAGVRQTTAPTVVLLPTWSIVPSRFWKAQVALPGPALPGGHLRRPGHRALGPAGRRGRLRRRASTSRTPSPCWTPPAPTAACWSALSCGCPWAVHVARRSTRTGCSGIVSHRPVVRLGVARPEQDAVGLERALRRRRRLGEVQQPLLAEGGYDDFLEFFFEHDVLRAALHQADRGLHRAGAGEIGPADACRHHGRPARLRRRACRRSSRSPRCRARCWSCTAPTTGSGRTRTASGSPSSPAARCLARGRRARPARPRPGDGQPPDHGVRRPGRAPRRYAVPGCARAEPAAAGALPVLADRARARAARPGDRAASCARTTRTCRSTGSPSTRSPGCSRTPARAVHPASAWLCNESAHIEHEAGEHDLHAFQAIRRMDEILVNNFMVFADVVDERALRPGDRRRGVGRRLLPAREPGAEAVRVRLDDRLRRLAADARRRRPRGRG